MAGCEEGGTPALQRRAALLGGLACGGAARAEGGPPMVPTVQLGSLNVSRTIQGYWQLAGGHGSYTEDGAIANMQRHFDAGVTALDTADIYGPSERIVGKFVAQQPGAVPCTKFCCFRGLDTVDKAEVRRRVEGQLQRLRVSSLPLVAFFWADYNVPRYVEVAKMLTELKAEGLIREIGATNFDTKRLKEMVDAGVPIVSNQVQLSLFDRRPLASGMADYCAANGIKLIAFGTVGGGLISERFLGAKQPPRAALDTVSLQMYAGSASRFLGDWGLTQELLQTLRGVGEKYQASIANVAQRYVLDSSTAVASVLIGVRNSDHIAENVRTHSFTLDGNDKAAIDAVLAKGRGPVGDVWGVERGLVRL